jgi:ABC-type dipeptide/oligopeptide/nickel transport system ATPase component
MFNLTKEDPIFSCGRRNTAYCYLQYVKNSLESELISIQDQRIQIHELVGESGIGKSRAISNLASIVCALVPFIPSGDIVYTRANDYWWNGYCGQPIILYDDFTHIKKKMKFDLVFELIAIASGTFRNPPMAFAKNMKFTSLLGIVTSNIPVLTTVREADTISAIKRRVSSKQWESTPGSRNSDNSMSFNGLLLNSIISDCSVFSLFSETHDIIQSECTYQFKINNAQYDYYDDEESMDPIGPTTTVLISSVPESYSAPCVVVVAPKERVISTDQSKIDHAQVNYKSTEEPMVSRKFTTHAPLPDDSSTSMKLLSFMSTWTQ